MYNLKKWYCLKFIETKIFIFYNIFFNMIFLILLITYRVMYHKFSNMIWAKLKVYYKMCKIFIQVINYSKEKTFTGHLGSWIDIRKSLKDNPYTKTLKSLCELYII